MLGFANKIAFVVPTKDRPDDLRRMLTSVQCQSVNPDQIIVVDGSEDPIRNIIKEFPKLNINYVRVYPPSLAKQRNAGVAAADPSMTVIGYLDDDLVLEAGAVEAMFAFWEKAAEDVGGARFNIINEEPPRIIWLKSLFLLDSKKRGEVLSSGYHTSIGRVTENRYVRWLSGGVTVWRREVIKNFAYDEWYQGTGYLEDVDYSYTVGKKYKLVVVADACVQHLSYPLRKDRNYVLGKWQAVNRVYFVKKQGDFRLPACYWSMLGEFLLNLATGIGKIDTGRLSRAWGNLVGLAYVAQGRIERLDGMLK